MHSQRSLTVVLPMRSGSKRVPNKNTKRFSRYRFGLAELKLRQILEVGEVSEILIDTDEPKIRDLIESMRLESDQLKKIRIEARDLEFAGSNVTTDSLIQYLGQKIGTDDALWTHVTSPFLNSTTYKSAIEAYLDRDLARNDSLMTVTKTQEFIWDANGPVNYSYESEKWPRSQTLPDWFFVNSGIFLCPSDFYLNKGNRIGDRPILFEIDKIKGFDIDWPEDFEMAEALAEKLLAT